MDDDHRLALQLAHEAEARDGMSAADSVVARARTYLDFLLGRGAVTTDQPSSDSERRGF
jgi:hypothetical protein